MVGGGKWGRRKEPKIDAFLQHMGKTMGGREGVREKEREEIGNETQKRAGCWSFANSLNLIYVGIHALREKGKDHHTNSPPFFSNPKFGGGEQLKPLW